MPKIVKKLRNKNAIKPFYGLIVQYKSLWSKEVTFKKYYASFTYEGKTIRVLKARWSQRLEDKKGFVDWDIAELDPDNGHWEFKNFVCYHTDVIGFRDLEPVYKHLELWEFTRKRLKQEQEDYAKRRARKPIDTNGGPL